MPPFVLIKCNLYETRGEKIVTQGFSPDCCSTNSYDQ